MPWLRHFALFVVFVAALLKPAAAGAFVSAPDAGSQARVGAFELVTATLVGASTEASPGLHEGIAKAYDENASGYRFAARGAALAVHPALPGAANTINHIFGKSAHQLEGLVTHFGSREAAYTALYDATQVAVRTQGTTGVFQTAVNVAGQSVTVRGNVIDGVLRLSTAFVP